MKLLFQVWDIIFCFCFSVIMAKKNNKRPTIWRKTFFGNLTTRTWWLSAKKDNTFIMWHMCEKKVRYNFYDYIIDQNKSLSLPYLSHISLSLYTHFILFFFPWIPILFIFLLITIFNAFQQHLFTCIWISPNASFYLTERKK